MNQEGLQRLVNDADSPERKILNDLVRGILFPVNEECQRFSKRRLHALCDGRVERLAILGKEMYAFVQETPAKIHQLYAGDVPEESRKRKSLPQINYVGETQSYAKASFTAN